MGKNSDLWDDSALINAFDDAVSKYKAMHGKKGRSGSAKGEKVVDESSEDLSVETDMPRRYEKEDENGNAASSTITGMGQTDTSNIAKESSGTDSSNKAKIEDAHNGFPASRNPQPHSHASDIQAQLSNDHVPEDMTNAYSNSQSVEEYNSLLTQYYELEEKRQKILQQLQPYGAWNNQSSGEAISNAQWGPWSTSQEYSVPYSQASYPTAASSCCTYACPLIAPCCSVPACAIGRMTACDGCNGTSGKIASEKSDPVVKNDIVDTAMEAAKKAISSVRIETRGSSTVNKETGKKEENDKCVAEITGQGTDLATVLNAWYSAGFYTGKYLTKQSVVKKGRG